ncbi:uncharacterized protein LOC106662109 [Cimex lectularius]|uniref:Osiris n=1 Tax=Cimex lectularius TaxID=79782 RepID=A0A8I6R8U2_CIMLE|nr:uncharacterized protein LOC106662109 [Cimex lectularius]
MSRVFLLLVGLCAFASAQDEMKLVLRVFEECSGPGVEASPCLKMKLISALDRASRARDLEILDGVHLIGEEQQENNAVSEPELEASLPRSLDDKENALDDIILDKVTKFVQSRSLQFKLTNLSEIPRSLGMEEARRKKKGGGIILLLLMMVGSMVKLKLGALAVLAGKALIIAKLALALAAIIGLKKLLSHHDDHHDYQVVQVPHHGHHRRSVDLPYRAYAPKEE